MQELLYILLKALEAVKLDNENYFDSNFFAYFEDVDLSLRLKDAGFKAKLLRNSIVYHMHSATGGKTTGFKEYYLTRNLFMYTKRNQSVEDYKKHKKEYYIRFLKTVVKNINNFNAVKSAVKGLNDGLKESKKIEYWKVQ
ncbi:glycosyltransferase family 2 protein [Clostridium sp.]|uniref:glycosyltransferase family 2 protein n=1 Tax=Clostridium sp. TaxID=1506 RepID=UPI0035224D54